ncbi:MAG TPA: hypothetical protein VL361_02155 [Candidatus Limnocylindrales bacterium]|nr:hypothetical protein [Candidatus Limnocylindrales bacterium]
MRSSGRKLLLVTGRKLDELLSVFPRADLFDAIIAENGAVLFWPATRTWDKTLHGLQPYERE